MQACKLHTYALQGLAVVSSPIEGADTLSDNILLVKVVVRFFRIQLMGIIKTIPTYSSLCFIKHQLVTYYMTSNIDRSMAVLGSPEFSTALGFLKQALFIFTVPYHTSHECFQMMFCINRKYSLKGQILAIIDHIYRNMLMTLEAVPKRLLGDGRNPGIEPVNLQDSFEAQDFPFLVVPIPEHFLKYCFCLCPQFSGGPRQT